MKDLEFELLDPNDQIGDAKKINRFYDRLRKSMKQWTEKQGIKGSVTELLLFAPDFFMLLVRMTKDKRVSFSAKTGLLAAIAYYLLPVDFLPEIFMGPIGFSDDLLLSVFVINKLLNEDRDLVLDNWSGSDNLLETVQRIIGQADKLVNKNIYNKIKKYFYRISK